MFVNRFHIDDEVKAITSQFPNHQPRPIIGITANMGSKGNELALGYTRSIELAGGIPLIIPITDNRVLLTALLDRIDGLVLSGGGDVNPLFAGEDPIPQLHAITPERDYAELLLVRLAYDRNIPILGICRGMQVLAMALGGSVHQDIGVALGDAATVKHSQDAPRYVSTHSVSAEAGSLIARLMGECFAVNSFHHQAVDQSGPHLHITARSADGVAEAMESTERKSIIGVQWHPECYATEGDRTMSPLFRHFVEQCESFRTVRRLHRDIYTLDSHCDTPMFYGRGANLAARHPDVRVDMHTMTAGGLDAAIMVAYLPQGERSDEALAEATLRADNLLQQIRSQVKATAGVTLAYSAKNLFGAKAAGQKAIMMGIENGYALGRDLSNVARFRRQGVVYLTLCHNGDNDLCDSARRSNREHGGLSAFGRQVVSEMNRVGMMVDLSHASEETFYDTVALSTQPVVCSHSSARALCNHPRNLTDDQLRTLAAAGGVAQCTFYHGFLTDSGEATIDDAVRHIMHMIDVAGIDHVGIGSDFDGDGGVIGLQTPADYLVLTQRLMAEGLTAKHLRRLWAGNFIRVMSRVQYAGLKQSRHSDDEGDDNDSDAADILNE